MSQVQSLFSIGNKPSDTKVQLHRAGRQFFLVLPDNKSNWRYYLVLLGSWLGLGLIYLEYWANWDSGDLSAIGLVSLVFFVIWGYSAFVQEGVTADGENISFVRKTFGKITKQDKHAISDFQDIELIHHHSDRRDELMDIVISFQDGSRVKFGYELSDEEQNWVMRELIEYLDAVKGKNAASKS